MREQEQMVQVFRPAGAFEVSTAVAIVRAVERLAPDVAVAVDLSVAFDVQDHELAILAYGLAATGRRIELSGLSRHHVRVLRYLGLDFARTADREADAAVEGAG
ncbi:hypothetical protein [Anaeromyxobacter oryzae]|uniref:STAS domain-containing protein n=1 Tax=Anaeromyxobacter oryzae TaxID=2918170 RepID=A0ABM7WRP6_9BACT|nr:hypothetical protein [Anaeromyxobacter oryzae]BDG02148.1 hypothetical protein AMOR_11440 [Anaeromyxobacter oryzae]